MSEEAQVVTTSEATPSAVVETPTSLPTGQEQAEVTEVVAEAVDTPEEVERKKTSGFEKRVNKLNAKVEAAAREAEYWKAEALKQSRQAAPVQQEQLVYDEKPKMSDYGTIEDYTEAVAAHMINQRDRQVAAKEATASQTKVYDTYNQRVQEFSKSTPDFQDVLDDAADIACAPEIHTVCLESDVGPQLAYYLAQNTEEIARLNNLSPNRRLLELGKLEDKLTAKKSAAPKGTKPAPAPVKPVSGPSSAAIEKSIYEMTPSELIAHRNKTDRARRGR